VGVPAPELQRVVPIRRRLLPPDPATRPAAEPATTANVVPIGPARDLSRVRGDEMRAALQRMRQQCQVQVEEMQHVFVTTQQLAEHTSALRERCRETRTHRRLPD
jgi:hypothetical protein